MIRLGVWEGHHALLFFADFGTLLHVLAPFF